MATEAQRSYLEHIPSRLQRDHGAEAIVLGGTDLFVAFDRKHYDYEIIDCAIVHAEAIASVAMGHSGDAAGAQETKVFWFFFSKKNCFLFQNIQHSPRQQRPRLCQTGAWRLSTTAENASRCAC